MKSGFVPGKREITWALLSAAVSFVLWKNRSRLPSAVLTQEQKTATPMLAVQQPPAAAAAATSQTHQPEGLKSYLAIMVSAAKAWSSRRAASKGAALALYTLFSLAPMLLLVVALAGFFFGTDTVSQAVLEQMQGLMGTQGADVVRTMLSASHETSKGIMAGIISVVLLLIGATTAFAELKDSLDELWQVPPAQGGGLWALIRQRFLSFGLILVLVLMLMTSLLISSGLEALGSVMHGFASESSFQALNRVISSVVTFLIVTGLFAAIFKYLPETPIAWRDVLVGAIITAFLFTLGKVLIGLYLGNGGVSNVYGAAASIVALISWIYYSAQIFFYGALFTHEYAVKHGSHSPQAV